MGAFLVFAALLAVPPLMLLCLLTTGGTVPVGVSMVGIGTLFLMTFAGIALSRGNLNYDDSLIRPVAWILPIAMAIDIALTYSLGAAAAGNQATVVLSALLLMPIGICSNYEARMAYRRLARTP
jgi:hypothetical protein